MNSIEIYINNIGNNLKLYIDTKKNKITINETEKEITIEKIDELIRIIRTWDNIYKDNNHQIDRETFLININTNEGIEYIKGEGGYPENYSMLKEWLGEYYE